MINEQPLENISSEHVNVKHLVDTVGNTMSDLDAFFKLETENFNLSQVSLQAIAEKTNNLEKMINNLWRDLKNHFDYEEIHLPHTLGETLTKALMAEHADIAREMQNVKDTIAASSFDGLTQQEMLVKKANLQQAIGRLCRMIEEHARDEDVLVKLVKKANKKGQ